MFSVIGLLQTSRCPDAQCTRPHCIFSHSNGVPDEIAVPVHVAQSVKRPSEVISDQRPTKVQKVGPSQRPRAVPTASGTSSSGTPVLKIIASQSTVPVPVRQTMLKSLYDHYLVLYQNILAANPTLASDHALKQEEQIYKKSSKLTYRNAVISSIAALKRRSVPDSISHESVGTEADLLSRQQSKKSIEAFRLTPAHLDSLLLSPEDMIKWDYIIEVPSGVGGEVPSEEGRIMLCERCRQPRQVKRLEEAEECVYHWGRPFSTRRNGEKVRIYSCCSQPTTSAADGCSRGPHVFYESKPEDLHRRHLFSYTRPPTTPDAALDVAALDCEMVYTTGGMRVTRVSVVDASGTEVFDQLVRMDDGVHIIDYNTRFSGITPENYSKSAVLQLAAIRKLLDGLINSDTILIGHALDNDLKTLRMIHLRNVDTAIIFKHHAGHPYRRALKDLTKEHLGQIIQTGGANVGHSSVEDSIATLNLVRWYVLNKPRLPKEQKPQKPEREIINVD